jgi:hypothetical protein
MNECYYSRPHQARGQRYKPGEGINSFPWLFLIIITVIEPLKSYRNNETTLRRTHAVRPGGGAGTGRSFDHSGVAQPTNQPPTIQASPSARFCVQLPLWVRFQHPISTYNKKRPCLPSRVRYGTCSMHGWSGARAAAACVHEGDCKWHQRIKLAWPTYLAR